MTVTWLDPAPRHPGAGGGLRLLDDARSARPDPDGVGPATPWLPPLAVVPDRRDRGPARRHASPEVRRRRTLLVVMGLLLLALALPLSGTGGHSHPIGSALAETGGPVAYTVQPGDSLWTIAERVDPTGDPRPLVARLASQIGSDTVVPGERILLP